MKSVFPGDGVLKALKEMQKFHNAQVEVHQQFGMTLLDNLGRRNIIMSRAQERFFADALKEHYQDVENDGRTGKPDIVINDIKKEIECKLTSRTSSGGINFQSDFDTLQNKGSLDYLYVMASREFDKFCVLYFENLSIEDFRPLSPGARGKVSMKKFMGMKKCEVLHGEVIDKNKEELKKINEKAKSTTLKHLNRMRELADRLHNSSKETSPRRYEKTLELIQNEKVRFDRASKKLEQKQAFWKECPTKYSFVLQGVM